jgi:hypothetical protein
MMNLLEELLKSRDALNQRIWKLQSQKSDEANAAYVGKYLVYDNGYNSRDRWPMYIHAKAIKDGCVICDWFQTDSYGEFSFRKNDPKGEGVLAAALQTTKSRYDSALAKALKKIKP